MTWNVRDEVWLAPIDVAPKTDAFDELDARVVTELAAAQPNPSVHALPPPPPSAAFDEGAAPTSYESGRFMVEPKGAGEGDPSASEIEAPAEDPSGFVIPSLARPRASEQVFESVEPESVEPESVEPESVEPESSELESSALEPESAEPESVESVEPEPADPSIDFVIPSLRRNSEPTSAPGELFIPSLRRPGAALESAPAVEDPSQPPAVEDRLEVALSSEPEVGQPEVIDEADSGVVEEVEDLEEVHELEEAAGDFHDQPVRTGDTVIGPAPTSPLSQDLGVASPVATSHSGSVTESVYDDDDDDDSPVATDPGSPETIARVDSAELEILHDEEDTAVGYPPEDDANAEPDMFVIPTLAAAPIGITPAEILIPLLTRPDAAESLTVESEDDHEPVLASAEPEEFEGLDGDDLEPEEVEEYEVEEPASELTARIEPPEPDAPEVRPPTPPPSAAVQDKRRKGWYDDVFAEHYQFLYPPSWEETARRDAEFIHAVLGLPTDATLLDVGCGDGRHALELGKLGMRVTGLDNSLALLLAAAQHKEQMAVEDQVSFLHGDMRRLPRDRQFDAVMCVGSTLGYFEEDQNRACIEEMIGRLTPTGRLLLHVFNRDFVAPQLPARSWWQGRRCMVLDEAEMNFFANRLRVHRTIIFDDGRQFEHYMFMRAFTVHDLGKSLSQMGMRVVEVSGSRDTRKRFYGAASPDIWILAERKT